MNDKLSDRDKLVLAHGLIVGFVLGAILGFNVVASSHDYVCENAGIEEHFIDGKVQRRLVYMCHGDENHTDMEYFYKYGPWTEGPWTGPEDPIDFDIK